MMKGLKIGAIVAAVGGLMYVIDFAAKGQAIGVLAKYDMSGKDMLTAINGEEFRKKPKYAIMRWGANLFEED